MSTSIRDRNLCWIGGGLLVLIGVAMPGGWTETLPRPAGLGEPPIEGITLFRCLAILEGLLLFGIGWRIRTVVRLRHDERLPAGFEASGIGRGTTLWALLAISLVGLALRLVRIDADLWLDEVRATLDATEMPVLQVIGTYVRSNVHLLNTLLMKLSIAVFGEAEWTARLPALLFGSATVPALYGVSRLTLSRGGSLATALLLAVSYHHVFFSQNARGYAAYLFFSLVSSALLVRALQTDRFGTWALYVATSLLNVATILISAFVLVAHGLVGAAALVQIGRRGGSPVPMAWRLVAVFGITGLLALHIYSLVIPEVFAYMGTAYTQGWSGYSLASLEFVEEVIRGLSAGFGPGLLLGVLPFLLLAALGAIEFLRRQWSLAAALGLPILLTGAALFLGGLSASPRLFLLALPVAILTAVLTIELSVEWVVAKRAGAAAWARPVAASIVIVLAAMSAFSLRGYYAVPKQSYRASLEFVESVRRPGEVVLAVHTARRGLQYYAPEVGLAEGRELFLADSRQELDAFLAGCDEAGVIVVTSFPRALRIEHPGLEERIQEDWRVLRRFPATIGDGEISVWRHRSR